jgi:hypothetical protein
MAQRNLIQSVYVAYLTSHFLSILGMGYDFL